MNEQKTIVFLLVFHIFIVSVVGLLHSIPVPVQLKYKSRPHKTWNHPSYSSIITRNKATSLKDTNVYCNRELDMNQIQVVGFDMDYTLAQYHIEFDLLAYEGAKKKLVDWLGYPENVLDLKYDRNISQRGCIIDRKRGNILKLDQHRYVRAVNHGLTTLSHDQRKSIYRESYQEVESFTGKEFSNIDTPFSLVDACLFAQLVDMKDSFAQSINLKQSINNEQTHKTGRESKTHIEYEEYKTLPEFSSQVIPKLHKNILFHSKSYIDIWQDLRRCLDRCHRDGAIKHIVAKDPAKYIIYDEKLFPMLKQLRNSGKKLFLLTNSLFDYTDVVMNYLEGGNSKAHSTNRDAKWMEYFDLIIVGGNKPAFLLDEGVLSLYKVNPNSGTLDICLDIPRIPTQSLSFLKQNGKIYQGGNAQILHTLLEISSGKQLLYIGDHIFADILRSKRSLGWSTCLIVPELTLEVRKYTETIGKYQELMELKQKQCALEERLDEFYRKGLTGSITSIATTDTTNSSTGTGHNNENTSVCTEVEVEVEVEVECREECSALERQLQELRGEIRERLAQYDVVFHTRWGQLFKAGFQESRILKQLRDYACLYTSKVSNLGNISPYRTIRPVRDMMPHDHFIDGL